MIDAESILASLDARYTALDAAMTAVTSRTFPYSTVTLRAPKTPSKTHEPRKARQTHMTREARELSRMTYTDVTFKNTDGDRSVHYSLNVTSKQTSSNYRILKKNKVVELKGVCDGFGRMLDFLDLTHADTARDVTLIVGAFQHDSAKLIEMRDLVRQCGSPWTSVMLWANAEVCASIEDRHVIVDALSGLASLDCASSSAPNNNRDSSTMVRLYLHAPYRAFLEVYSTWFRISRPKH